ncbi:hypothetical protein [Massilia endophytica]|uniref:hypothetical protein n=1 Tax=Massilia endophytica TaxID=2899220 RepID=UPI001E2CEB0D|nr:hypothetical protein [Massilia endophytica]UGQ48742.1 hypothetical protein LSQ66_09860 [Massilia endophytica]
MLRLWPERITAGLFPGACWLRRGGKSAAAETASDTAGLLEALDGLLQEAKPGRAQLDIVVSDSLARVIALPWQDKLDTQAQWEAYAAASYAGHGLELDAGWVSHAAFRHFGESGIASAMPRSFMEKLESLAAAHGCRLRTVLPVTAAAYWSPRSRVKGARGWLLIEERAQASLLCFERGRLKAMDTQPCSADPHRALTQLLRRAALRHGEPATLNVWHLDGEPSAAVVGECLPQAAVRELPRHYWDDHV